jgi:hypothetical protein
MFGNTLPGVATGVFNSDVERGDSIIEEPKSGVLQ